MMNFELNEETKGILDTARRFVEKEIKPRSKEEGFKRDIVSKMGELGFFGCAFPARFGGSDSGFLAHSVVCEEISARRLGAAFPLQSSGDDRPIYDDGMGHRGSEK